MNALILAAGLGSRLRPLTLECPKAMVKYQGKEIISYQIDALFDSGINNVIVVSGYKSKQLENFLIERYKNKIVLINNSKYNTTNSAYSFMKAYDQIQGESYIHLNCDILFSKKLLDKIINSDHKNILATRGDIEFSNAMENVITLDNRIINMAHRYTSQVSCKGFGLAKISRNALKENIIHYRKLIPEVQKKENYYGLIRMSLGNIDYYIENSSKTELAEINTLEDLAQCSFNQ